VRSFKERIDATTLKEEENNMSSATLTQLDQHISLLSRDEQLWLIERVIHRLRRSQPQPALNFAEQLQVMARDPEIQQELQAGNAEFLDTEMDGLA
jgi:hypothetical protein